MHAPVDSGAGFRLRNPGQISSFLLPPSSFFSPYSIIPFKKVAMTFSGDFSGEASASFRAAA